MIVFLLKMFQNTGLGRGVGRNASKLFLLSQHNTDTKLDKKSSTHVPPTLQATLACVRPRGHRTAPPCCPNPDKFQWINDFRA